MFFYIKNSFDICTCGFQSHFLFKYVVFKDSAKQKMHNSHSLSASPRLQSTNGSQQCPISTATVSMVHSVPELMVSAEVSHVMATWETGLRPMYFIPTSLLSTFLLSSLMNSIVTSCCIYSQPCKIS